VRRIIDSRHQTFFRLQFRRLRRNKTQDHGLFRWDLGERREGTRTRDMISNPEKTIIGER
jgi:hypothetical protein